MYEHFYLARFLKARKERAKKKHQSAMEDQGHKEFVTGKRLTELVLISQPLTSTPVHSVHSSLIIFPPKTWQHSSDT